MKLSKTQFDVLKRLANGDEIEYINVRPPFARFADTERYETVRINTLQSLRDKGFVKLDRMNIWIISESGRKAIAQMENE